MKKIFYTLFFNIFFLSALCAQNNYYVSKYGKNKNNGSFSMPWQTIQYGCDELQPGDTLNILEGTYYEKISLNVSGEQNKLITIKAYKNDSVFIDGQHFKNKKALFDAYNKSNFTVENINFKNSYHLNGYGGFYVSGYGENIILKNCSFNNIGITDDPDYPVTYHTNHPIVSFLGDHDSKPLKNILVNNIKIYNCHPGFSECLSIDGNATSFEFSNNHIYNNKNIGIDIIGNYGTCSTPDLDYARNGIVKNNICHGNYSPVSAAAGIYVDGGQNITIENNILYENDYGAEIGCEETGITKNVVFKNNILYNNSKAGIALGGYDEETNGRVINCKILNNTFYNNDTENDGNGEIYFTQFEDGEVSNNIFYLSAQNYLMSSFRSQPNLVMDYNLIYCKEGPDEINAFWNDTDLESLETIITTTGIGTNNIFGNPDFVNVHENNFSISKNSAAINAGNPNYIIQPNEKDISGNARVNDSILDCGANEFNN